MTAVFHCRGTTEVETDKLNSVASGWQRTGAPRRRNQALIHARRCMMQAVERVEHSPLRHVLAIMQLTSGMFVRRFLVTTVCRNLHIVLI